MKISARELKGGCKKRYIIYFLKTLNMRSEITERNKTNVYILQSCVLLFLPYIQLFTIEFSYSKYGYWSIYVLISHLYSLYSYFQNTIASYQRK